MVEKIYFGMDSKNFYFAFYGDISKIEEFTIRFEEYNKKLTLPTRL